MNFKSILVNWKTSVVGLAALLAAIANVLNELGHGESFITILTGPIVSQLFLAVLGLVAKDGNVTGGTVAQLTTVATPIVTDWTMRG